MLKYVEPGYIFLFFERFHFQLRF